MSCPNCTNLTMLIFKGDLWNLLFQGSIFSDFQAFVFSYSRGIHVCILQGGGLRSMKDLAALPSFDETSHPFSRHTFANLPPEQKISNISSSSTKKMPPKTTNDNRKSTLWTCFFYWTWRFSSVMLVSQGCYPTGSSSPPTKKKRQETPEPTWRPLVPCSRLSVPHRDTPKPSLANLGHTCQVARLVRWDEGRFIPVTQVHPFCRGNCKGDGDFILQEKQTSLLGSVIVSN